MGGHPLHIGWSLHLSERIRERHGRIQMHPLVLVLTSHNLQVRFQLQLSDVAQAIILHQIVYSAVTWYFEVSSCFLVRRDAFSLFPVCHNSVQVFSAYLFGSSGHLTLFHFLLHWSGLCSLSGTFLVVTIPDLCVWWWQRFLCLLLFISEETGSYCWSDQLEHMWEASLVCFSENTFDWMYEMYENLQIYLNIFLNIFR